MTLKHTLITLAIIVAVILGIALLVSNNGDEIHNTVGGMSTNVTRVQNLYSDTN